MVQRVLENYFDLRQQKKEINEQLKSEKERILSEYVDGTYKVGEDKAHEYFMVISTERVIRHKKEKKKGKGADLNYSALNWRYYGNS